jgi:hypothetical protein
LPLWESGAMARVGNEAVLVLLERGEIPAVKDGGELVAYLSCDPQYRQVWDV